jgi:putative acetyltransferase
MLTIRLEQEEDYAAIDELLTVAFAFDAYSKQNEAEIVRELRASGALWVSLVALLEEERVGQIAFSPITISDGTQGWAALGPISVDPRLQRRGIGRRLMEAGLQQLQEQGAAGCVVLGEASFYQYFGFREVPELILPGVHADAFMAQVFAGDMPSGTVSYHPAFASA